MSESLSDRLTVKVGDEDRQLFMSFGILNAIASALGNNIENVGMISVNPDLRNGVLGALLSKRDEKGVITEEFNSFVTELSTEDGEKILEWAGDHVLGFFIRAMETQARLVEKNKERVAKFASTASAAGSKA
jgi:hypothetical protein